MTDLRPQGGSSPQTEDCAEFQARLPQLFESKVDQEKEPHLKSCERCAELVRDLNYIAVQAKMLLPIHDPSPEVWKKIEREIVISEGSH